MDPTSATWRMANRLVDGQLADILRGYEAAGLSLRAISERLWTEHRIEVAHVTVGNWLTLLRRDDEPVAS